MGSTTPNTNMIRSGERESVPEDDQLIGSKTDSMDRIKFIYGEEMLEGMDAADTYKRHDLVAQWYEWCDLNYPGTNVLDWPGMASAAGEDVDIRLLIRGYPIAGYAILLFLEACYAVDKALCGTDLEALAEVKVWHMPQEMKAYKYLLSEEMKLWWATELGELENEIKSSFSNQVSLSWRIADLTKCLAKLEVVMDCGEGIGTNIWTTMGEENDSGPPAGVDDAIYERVGKLKTSVEILCKALERSKQDLSSAVLPSDSHRKVEPSGIRRRIPQATSGSINEHNLVAVETSLVNNESIAPTSNVASSIRSDPLLGATPRTPSLPHLRLVIERVRNRFKKSKIRSKAERYLPRLVEKGTVLFISLSFVITSITLTTWSAILAHLHPITSGNLSLTSDPYFLGDLSQSLLSYLSIYLVIATAVHNRSEGLPYQPWVWVYLAVSFMSNILGLCLYTSIPPASIAFLWFAAFAQVVIPLLLIIVTEASKTEDDVESHRD